MYLPDAKVLRIIRINLISLFVESCLFKVICMKNSFIVLFALSMAVIGCDKNHDNEDTDVTLGKISRIDVRSYSEEDDVYFNKIFCFSYDLDGKISSCSILYPSDAYREERIDEEIRYSMDYSQSSLALSVDYRMLMYDGIHDDYAIGSETEHDMADCFEMVEYVDAKNGVDIFNDGGFITFMAYGQHYKKNDKFYNVQYAIQIRPFDENKEYVYLFRK